MKTINKTEALKRLTILENETKMLRQILDVPVEITDRIKKVADAFQFFDRNHEGFLEGCTESGDTPDEIAYKEAKVIMAALNEGWKPNWKDKNEQKWQIWFEFNEGSGFSLYDVFYCYASSGVGSRLCFKNRKLAEYAAKQFASTYNALFL